MEIPIKFIYKILLFKKKPDLVAAVWLQNSGKQLWKTFIIILKLCFQKTADNFNSRNTHISLRGASHRLYYCGIKNTESTLKCPLNYAYSSGHVWQHAMQRKDPFADYVVPTQWWQSGLYLICTLHPGVKDILTQITGAQGLTFESGQVFFYFLQDKEKCN